MNYCETCKHWVEPGTDKETGEPKKQGTCLKLRLTPPRKGEEMIRCLYNVSGPELKVGRKFGCVHWKAKD